MNAPVDERKKARAWRAGEKVVHLKIDEPHDPLQIETPHLRSLNPQETFMKKTCVVLVVFFAVSGLGAQTKIDKDKPLVKPVTPSTPTNPNPQRGGSGNSGGGNSGGSGGSSKPYVIDIPSNKPAGGGTYGPGSAGKIGNQVKKTD